MPGHDPEKLLDPLEGTRDSLDSLEIRFRRAYGRDMTAEERKYFALVEHLVRFEPDGGTKPGKIHDLEDEGNDATTQKPDGPDSGNPKAA